MPSPDVETVDSTVNSAATDSVTVTKPTGVANDDVLLFVAEVNDAHSDTWTAPLGFSLELAQAEDGGNDSLRVYRKIITNAAGEPADYTLSWEVGNDNRNCGAIIRVSGADTTTPVAVSAGAASNTGSADPPNADPGSSDDYLSVAIAGLEGKDLTTTPPTTPGVYTEEVDVTTTGGGAAASHAALSIASRQYTGQAENPGTFTPSSVTDWRAITVIVAPAAPTAAKPITATLTAPRYPNEHRQHQVFA